MNAGIQFFELVRAEPAREIESDLSPLEGMLSCRKSSSSTMQPSCESL